MQINWKIVVPVVVFILLLVVIATQKGKDKSDVSIVAPEVKLITTPPPEPSGVPVSGNVDELAGVLTAEADKDAVLLSDSSIDVSLVTSDRQDVTNVISSYDETTF